MSARKKKLIFIQTTLLIVAILLLYFFYYKESVDDKLSKETKIEDKKIEKLSESNFFENVEYKGIDASGNRYLLKSQIASFDNEKPELVNMEGMKAIFYFKDGTILKVFGNNGTYNNKTNDMQFRDNIKAEYEESYLFSDNLDFLSTQNSLSIYGNVRTESIQGSIIADNLKFDLSSQTLDVTMFSDKQVNVELKKK